MLKSLPRQRLQSYVNQVPSRTFFSNDSISNLLLPSCKLKYQKCKDLRFTNQQLYDVVVDVDQYSQFLPFCSRAQFIKDSVISLSQDPKASGTMYNFNHKTMPCNFESTMTIGFSNFTETYISSILCKPYSLVQVTNKDSSLFSSLLTKFQISPKGKGSLLDFYIEFEVKNKLYYPILSTQLEPVADKIIQAFENRLYQLYPKN